MRKMKTGFDINVFHISYCHKYLFSHWR